ncbi:MAG: aminopeptidase N, partial [Burkholderiaceae bacterium]|nr:aminopeptidase N [Burkholderiaceae bacterium]
MRNDDVVTIRRTDYLPPSWQIETIELEFDLDPARTVVTATSVVTRQGAGSAGPLTLDGEDLELLAIEVDGRTLATDAYAVQTDRLVLTPRSDRFTLKIRNAIAPRANSELMGLYVSHDNFFTQCEAEGFRRITYFTDRPDVMATYAVTLRADATRYPVLLANG